MEVVSEYEGKVVLVTGGAGCIGTFREPELSGQSRWGKKPRDFTRLTQNKYKWKIQKGIKK